VKIRRTARHGPREQGGDPSRRLRTRRGHLSKRQYVEWLESQTSVNNTSGSKSINLFDRQWIVLVPVSSLQTVMGLHVHAVATIARRSDVATTWI
jgi:hypothetical protein